MAASQNPDTLVLTPFTPPVSEPARLDAVWKVGKYTFRADFDSGNLGAVKQGPSPSEFHLWTKRDCQNTDNERGTRSWFYFGVTGHSVGDFMVMTIMNLNKQGRLFSQDYRPWCCSLSLGEWQPLNNKVSYKREGDDFQLRFSHKFESADEMFFAFAIPFSYRDTQNMLDRISRSMQHCTTVPPQCASPDARHGRSHPAREAGPDGAEPGLSPTQADNARHAPSAIPTGARGSRRAGAHSLGGAGGAASRIYFNRVLLARSIEGRHVDLITITDCHGASDEMEPLPPAAAVSASLQQPGHWLLGEQQGDQDQPAIDLTQPAVHFPHKKVFFVSARVHPGETPATHMFNGLLAFLLRQNDARAAALRRMFVFKLVPIVNPDGVYHGFYRTDTLGQNLNRYYIGNPNRDLQPSVWAIKRQLMHYVAKGSLEFYLDLHAHANKKGVFIYGNALDSERALSSLLYAKLIALNSPVFDFMSCNYTEKNMSRADKDGISKEGAARVALFKETNLTHLYTIEANYNTARALNIVSPATGDHNGRASPPSGRRFPPKFAAPVLHQVGRAFVVAALDLKSMNPWSRLPTCEHRSLEGTIAYLTSVARSALETRMQHLPSLSDTCLDSLRALPSCVSLESMGLGPPLPPSAPQGPQAAAAPPPAAAAATTSSQPTRRMVRVSAHSSGCDSSPPESAVEPRAQQGPAAPSSQNHSKDSALPIPQAQQHCTDGNSHTSAASNQNSAVADDRRSGSSNQPLPSTSTPAASNSASTSGRRYLPSLPAATTQTITPAASGIPPYPAPPQPNGMFPARALSRSASLPLRSMAGHPHTARLQSLARIPSAIPKPPSHCLPTHTDSGQSSGSSRSQSDTGEGPGMGSQSGAYTAGPDGRSSAGAGGRWQQQRIRSGRSAGAGTGHVPVTEMRIKLAEPVRPVGSGFDGLNKYRDTPARHAVLTPQAMVSSSGNGADMSSSPHCSATALVMATGSWQPNGSILPHAAVQPGPITPRFHSRLLASLAAASQQTTHPDMLSAPGGTATHPEGDRPLRASVSVPVQPPVLVTTVDPVVSNLKVVGKLPAFKPGRRRSALVGGM